MVDANGNIDEKTFSTIPKTGSSNDAFPQELYGHAGK